MNPPNSPVEWTAYKAKVHTVSVIRFTGNHLSSNANFISFIDAIYSNDLDWGEICPPACSETKYYSSIATVPKSNADGDSVVNVFFKDSSIIKYKRVELYKITDIICKYISDFYVQNTYPKLHTYLYMYLFFSFLANIGGSLGLCTGFSLMSAIELVYFLTFRYFFKRSRN